MSMPTQTLLFLGATGGVTNAVLTHALQSNAYTCIALVRTPEKLKTQLTTQQGLSESALRNLIIVQGNALDLSHVKRALKLGPTGSLPVMVLTGLGGAPALTFDIQHPLQIAKLDNPSICEEAARTLIKALKEIYSEFPRLSDQKPALSFVSTTGISRGPEDVPWAMRYLYHEMLAMPHADKKKMEDVFRNQSEGVFGSVTGIRPTLLAGTGALSGGKGLEKVRTGVEASPATGYQIQRADVGGWVWENVVQMNGAQKWRGEMVSLTY